MRAGPDTAYPRVAVIPRGQPVEIAGCLGNQSWCDVIWGPNRGWVYGDYLAFMYQGRTVLVPEYAPVIGIPVVGFEFGNYWGRYYRGAPWWNQYGRWQYYQPRPRPGWGAPPPGPGPRPPGWWRNDYRPGPYPGPGGYPGRPPAPPPPGQYPLAPNAPRPMPGQPGWHGQPGRPPAPQPVPPGQYPLAPNAPRPVPQAQPPRPAPPPAQPGQPPRAPNAPPCPPQGCPPIQ